MSRRVPEFAVVTGVFLGVAVAVSGVVLGWGLYATVVLAVLAIGAPAATYATRYGTNVNPLSPRTTVLVGLASGVALVVWGLAVGRPLTGLAAGGVAGIGSALYGTERGVDIEARTKRRVAAAGGVVGVGIVGVGVVRGGPLGEWLLAGIAVAAIPSLYAALTAEPGTGRSRSRR